MSEISLLDFLQKVKEKPHLFFRNEPSYDKLLEMILSYVMIAPVVDLPSSMFLNDFFGYIEKHYGLSGVVRSHCNIITLFTFTDEEAYYTFYELLDEFLKTQQGYQDNL